MAIRISIFWIFYIITILQCRIDRPVRSPEMMQGGPAVRYVPCADWRWCAHQTPLQGVLRSGSTCQLFKKRRTLKETLFSSLSSFHIMYYTKHTQQQQIFSIQNVCREFFKFLFHLEIQWRNKLSRGIYSYRERTTFQNVNKRPCIVNYLEQLTLNLCTTAE